MKGRRNFIIWIFLFTGVILTQLLNAQTWTKKGVAYADYSTRPTISADPLGHLHIVWTSGSVYGKHIEYASNQSGKWSFRRIYTSSGSGYDAYCPVVTSDKYGFAYIVSRLGNNQIRYYSNAAKTSGSWNNYSPLMSGGHFHESSIEADSKLGVHIFAQDDLLLSYGTIFYQEYKSASEIIPSGAMQFYSTAIDHNDVLHFVGYKTNKILYTYYNNSTKKWSTYNPIASPAAGAYQPSITCDKNGVLHVVYGVGTGGDIYYMNNKSGWSTPVKTNGSGIYAQIAGDENGWAHVAFHTSPDPGGLYYMNNMNSGTWSTPKLISTINTDASPASDDVAHSGSKIALDLKNSTVNIVYIKTASTSSQKDSVMIASTNYFELRSKKTVDITSTLTSNLSAPETDTVSTSTTGEITLMDLSISDKGNSDLVATKMKEMVFQLGPGTTQNRYMTDFFTVMKVIVTRYDNTTSQYNCSLYAYKAIVGETSKVWESVTNGKTSKITLKATLKSPLSNVAGNTVQLRINGLNDVITDPTGSQFAYNSKDIYSDTLLFKLKDFDGSGTATKPFLIADLNDLKTLSENSAYWASGLYFRQIANIDASPTKTWNSGQGFSPIGSGGSFEGSYEGDGYTIDGLYINRPTEYYVGLFGFVAGTVKNLFVTNVNLTGGYYSSGFAGFNKGTIQNCYSDGSVTGSTIAGGLVGYCAGTITTCYSTVDVTATYGPAGGFVGYLAGTTITNCYSLGSVTRASGSTYTEFAGFCGRNYDGKIKNCYSAGKVIYTGATNPTDKGFAGGMAYTKNVYTDNFFDKEYSGQTSASTAEPSAATGKTTAEMKTVATFTDITTSGLSAAWDFVNDPNDDTGKKDYWDIDLTKNFNKGYPYLNWPACDLDIHWTEEKPGQLIEQWTSKDIWVQDTKPLSTTKAPLKNSSFQAGKTYYICARFRNKGNFSARKVRTDFYMAASVGDMIIDLDRNGVFVSGTTDNAGTFTLINSATAVPEVCTSATVKDYSPKDGKVDVLVPSDSATVYIEWVPSSSTPEHRCLAVIITSEARLEYFRSNNTGQENVWVTTTTLPSMPEPGVPYEFSHNFRAYNPFIEDGLPIRLQLDYTLPNGWEAFVEPEVLDFQVGQEYGEAKVWINIPQDIATEGGRGVVSISSRKIDGDGFYGGFSFVLELEEDDGAVQMEPVDLDELRRIINERMDDYHLALSERSIDAISSFLTDDGLYCGTDPDEFWNREEVIEIIAASLDDESVLYDYPIERREILVDEDGNTATVIEQVTVEWITPQIPIRLITHLVRIGEEWKINFFSWSLVPRNDDVQLIREAFE